MSGERFRYRRAGKPSIVAAQLIMLCALIGIDGVLVYHFV